MKNNLFAGQAGISTKTIEIDGKNVVLVSAMGPQKMIAATIKAALREGTLDPANIFAAGISRNGMQLHVAIAYVNGDAIGDTPVTLSKKQASSLLLADYDYFSFISTMQDGVNVAGLDEHFVPNDNNGKAFGNFASAVLDGDGEKIRGSAAKSRTLLLLGRTGKRTLVVCRYGINGPLTKLTTPVDGGVQEFNIVGGHTVNAALVGGDRIFATNVTEIVRSFEKDGIVPMWHQQQLPVGYTIEGISLPIDESQTVIVTASKEGVRKLIPAAVRWDKTEGGYANFRFQLHEKDAIETIELGGWTPAPMRISAQTDIVVGRDNNGGENLLGVRTVDGYAPGKERFKRLVTDAASGVYAAAA